MNIIFSFTLLTALLFCIIALYKQKRMSPSLQGKQEFNFPAFTIYLPVMAVMTFHIYLHLLIRYKKTLTKLKRSLYESKYKKILLNFFFFTFFLSHLYVSFTIFQITLFVCSSSNELT